MTVECDTMQNSQRERDRERERERERLCAARELRVRNEPWIKPLVLEPLKASLSPPTFSVEGVEPGLASNFSFFLLLEFREFNLGLVQLVI